MTLRVRTNVASFPDVRRALTELERLLNQINDALTLNKESTTVALNVAASYMLREDGGYVLREDDWRIVHEQENAYVDGAQQAFQGVMLHEDGGLLLREDATMIRREFNVGGTVLTPEVLFDPSFIEFEAPPIGS